MPIRISHRGNWDKTTTYLSKFKNNNVFASLEKYGAQGVAALSAATPVESGATASSWTYEIVQRKGYYSIRWRNTNVQDGQLIAALLQYGHGTGTGGYIQGRDYINPAMRPVFDQIVAEAWKAVNS